METETLYQRALHRAQQEIDHAYLAAGPAMWPDRDTYWTLVSERAHELCRDVGTDEVAAMLGVSKRRVQAILDSGAIESRRVGHQRLVPWLAADEYAAVERKPGRPRKA